MELLATIKKHNIPKTDAVGDFSIYCSKEPKDEFSKTVRGVIFGKDCLIHRGFSYSEDVGTHEETTIQRLIDDKWRACLSFEGSVIKLIYFGEQWNMTTHRRLDATKSKWGSSRSFGNIFIEGVKKFFPSFDVFLSMLDKKLHYHFLLKSAYDTRIVVLPDDDEPIVLTAVTSADTFSALPLEPVGTIPTSKTLQFENASEVSEFVRSCDPFLVQGIIFFSPDMQQSIRIANEMYLKYVAVRDNLASLTVCYAFNRMKCEEKQMYLMLYPEGLDIATKFEEKLENICAELHKAYINRYVYKKQFRVSQQRHAILNLVHTHYMKNVKSEKRGILMADVFNVLNQQKPLMLHRLVKGRETFVFNN